MGSVSISVGEKADKVKIFCRQLNSFFLTNGDTMSYEISYKNLTQTLIKIKAGKMDGKWIVYTIKKSVQRLCEKMKFNPNDLTELKL